METLMQDLRHARRILWQSPGFTLIAIAALALGIGANTAIFSVVNKVLLQPLPYSQPDRMVRVGLKFPNGLGNSVSVPKFMAWRDNTTAFSHMAIYNFAGPGLNLSGAALPEQIKGIHVSADYFPVFDAQPLIGRVFTPDEDKPNGPKLAVLSHGLWIRRFAGDPQIVGKSIVLNGEPYTIIGVLRASFRSYPPSEVFLPLQVDPHTSNQGHYLSAAARLKPGVTLEQAQAQMKVAAERFRAAYPKAIGKQESAGAELFQEAMVGDVKTPLFVLLGAVGLVLLIACANVANLQLARATGRSRELAIRSALGAGRWRIIRQLLTESVLLSMAGGVVGLIIGIIGARGLIALTPGDLPRSAELTSGFLLDWRLLAFTAVTAIVTGVLFGLFPALQISRTDVTSTIKESSSRSGTGRHHWTRNALVVSEVALALVLLIGATLLIRTFASLRQVDAGFNPRHVLTYQTSLGGSRFATTDAVDRMARDAIRSISTVNGVQSAALVPFLPLEGGFGLGFDVVGRANPPGDANAGGASWMYVTDDYFKTLEIPVRRGRVFNERDSRTAPGVVIVNDAFVKKFFPKKDAMGQQIVIGKGMGPDFTEGPREIVGVVGDVKEGGLGQDAPPVMYIPLSQLLDSFMTLNNAIIPVSWMVRTNGSPLTYTSAVRKQMEQVDSQLAVSNVRAFDQVLGEATARQDFNMTLLSVFAGLALLLAMIGVYGMLSYMVRQRSQEIGIRRALGAQDHDVSKLVLKQGMLMAIVGIVVGLAAAAGLARLLTAMLYGVKAYDPLTFVLAPTLLALIALGACWLPARRATKVDPMIALRYE